MNQATSGDNILNTAIIEGLTDDICPVSKSLAEVFIRTEFAKNLLLDCRCGILLLKGYWESLKEELVEHVSSNESSVVATFTFSVGSGDDVESTCRVNSRPIFLRKTPFPSRMLWRQRILLEARSISSRSKMPSSFECFNDWPLCQTVLPSIRRKPPIRSSSSVSIVMFTRMSSRPSWAHACSTENVLPLPERPVINVG